MKRTHTGWSAEEDKLLLDAVRSAKNAHTSLQAAFETVADVTERRPNSVRNRYYTQLKPIGAAEPSFCPFSEEETDRLLRTVLLAQADGRSVRACTLEMANGDTRRMLRYQNKYRALLKAQPDRVMRIRSELSAQGISVPDPFVRDPNRPHVGRPPKQSRELEHSIRALLDNLYRSLIALTQNESAM